MIYSPKENDDAQHQVQCESGKEDTACSNDSRKTVRHASYIDRG